MDDEFCPDCGVAVDLHSFSDPPDCDAARARAREQGRWVVTEA